MSNKSYHTRINLEKKIKPTQLLFCCVGIYITVVTFLKMQKDDKFPTFGYSKAQ